MSYGVVPYISECPTQEETEQFRSLYRQLSSDTPPHGRLLTAGIRIALQRGSRMWVGVDRRSKTIVATGLLVPNFKPILSESFGSIEDVVTDKKHRGKYHYGQSLAELILLEIIQCASGMNLKYLQLTNTSRCIPANKLFQKFGFVRIADGKKNFYRLYLGGVSSLLS